MHCILSITMSNELSFTCILVMVNTMRPGQSANTENMVHK